MLSAVELKLQPGSLAFLHGRATLRRSGLGRIAPILHVLRTKSKGGIAGAKAVVLAQ
jgi:hypothetical protein